MKRKAFDAGLPWDMTDYIIRMDVYVRDYLTRNELLPLAFAALSSRQH